MTELAHVIIIHEGAEIFGPARPLKDAVEVVHEIKSSSPATEARIGVGRPPARKRGTPFRPHPLQGEVTCAYPTSLGWFTSAKAPFEVGLANALDATRLGCPETVDNVWLDWCPGDEAACCYTGPDAFGIRHRVPLEEESQPSGTVLAGPLAKHGPRIASGDALGAEVESKVEVLDQGFVELLGFLGDDDAPVDAARVSFDKRAENYTAEQNDKLTKYLIDHKHGSPFEMVTFKFRIHAPVVVWWQWVRHRVASYNFVSGRYVPFDDKAVYRIADDAWRKQSKDNKQGSTEECLDPELGRRFNARMGDLFKQAFGLYDDLLAKGVAKEQARLVLPFAATYYTAIVQMNARSLINFLDLRRDSHAQWEIRQFADAVHSIVHETHPRIFP